jgi:sulfoxide reductase heme-binding subunit YedZ
MKTIQRYLRDHWLWVVANLGAAIPILWLIWDTWMDNLTVNPIDDFTERTGKAALILLVVTLAVTPASFILGWKAIVKVRKSMGLWAFFYVFLHLLVFVGLDYAFSLEFILKDGLPQKPYVVAGFAAFCILVPLAITSTKGWMKRLGRNWKRLHQWVYAAGILAGLHFIWLSKTWYGEPAIYGSLIVILLAVRLPWIRKPIVSLRQRLVGDRRPQRPTSQRPRERPAVAAKPVDPTMAG